MGLLEGHAAGPAPRLKPGPVRFRRMARTAAGGIVGSAVIWFDRFFQGLGISLMTAEVGSLLLSRVTVPVIYFMAHRGATAAAGGAVPLTQAAEVSRS